MNTLDGENERACMMLHLLSSEPGQAGGRLHPAPLERVITATPRYIASRPQVLDVARTHVQTREPPA